MRRIRGLIGHSIEPRASLLLLLVLTTLTRLVWLSRPDRSLIFDEAYYVNAARRILGRAVAPSAPYAASPAGLDPNSEHPPLGKLLIAGSMRVFGDNPLGWRAWSVASGVLIVAVVYLLVRQWCPDPWMAVYSALIASLDNLLFVHSRIATLDVLFLAPLMVAAVLVARQRVVLAGIACAFAILVKLPAALGVFGIALFVLVRPDRDTAHRAAARRAGLLLAVTGALSLAGLWLLDIWVTPFSSPFSHLHHMLSYGFDLTRSGGASNSESAPWQWLSNEVQIPYLRVDTNVSVNGKIVSSRPSVYFRGAMNPAVIGPALAAVGYSGWRWVRTRDPLGCWVVTFSAAVFVPYLALAVLAHRVSYLYYALPLVVPFAVAEAQLLWHDGLPRICRWAFATAVMLGFVAYFPFRSILQF